MNNQLYVMMIKNLANHIKSEENRREMEATEPHTLQWVLDQPLTDIRKLRGEA